MAAKKKPTRKAYRKRNVLPLAVATGAAGTAAFTSALPGYYRDAKGILRDASGQISRIASKLRNPEAKVLITEVSPKRYKVESWVNGDYSYQGGLTLKQAWALERRIKDEAETRSNPEDIEFLNDMAPLVSEGHLGFTADGLEEFVRDGFMYHAFANTPVFEDGYRMGTPVEALEEVAQENPAKFERCVRAVQRRGGAANAYAVCTAAGTRNRRRNPAAEADALYETFHGAPPQETLEIVETEHVHSHLAGLGDLVSIVVRLEAGKYKGDKFDLKAPDPETADPTQVIHFTANEAANQLYLVGGAQSIDLDAMGFRDKFTVTHEGEKFDVTDIRDLMVIGKILKLMYRTEKAFDKFETVDYFHEAGEDTKERPFLLYDVPNQRLKIAGGEYGIDARGVIN